MATHNNPAPIVRPATCIDVHDLLTYMQGRWLLVELNGSSYKTPQEALTAAFDKSPQSFAIEKNGHLAAVFGVVPLPDSKGSLWLFGTDVLNDCDAAMHECLDRLRDYSLQFKVHSAISSTHTLLLSCLTRLGFTFDGRTTQRGDETFLHFRRGLWTPQANTAVVEELTANA